MMTIILSTITASILSITIMMMCMTISKKTTMDKEKMSPFECGFDPKSSPRMPFSVQFFLIAILFLIFDIEIVIIMPMIITMKESILMIWTPTMFTFIIILILGLLYEWNNGVLEWAK
uniref:NADH-ubiquinone oxidoreductase chain 3 n=1 Tax=Brontostoma colossus TaxID=1532881 RepID=A0A076L8Z3_9HEMI|nr:NADH dehydrogenase subunit 3 [Brontostoma colossus]AIJ02997.1 NADH dehydrogenase subunit 3 [Brontostoma colossus]